MYAVTDGFSGLTARGDTPGTGMNFLVHNMCRLPGSDGTFMIVKGGMGTVTARIGEAARKAGATIETGQRRSSSILVDGGRSRGVVLADGTELSREGGRVQRRSVPHARARRQGALPAEYNARLDGYLRDGTTMKVNLALRGLPKFTCLPGGQGAVRPDDRPLARREGRHRVARARASPTCRQGRLPEFPTMEWYIHTTVDPTMKDEHGPPQQRALRAVGAVRALRRHDAGRRRRRAT